jgi:hypothetical protein
VKAWRVGADFDRSGLRLVFHCKRKRELKTAGSLRTVQLGAVAPSFRYNFSFRS